MLNNSGNTSTHTSNTESNANTNTRGADHNDTYMSRNIYDSCNTSSNASRRNDATNDGNHTVDSLLSS